MLGFLDLTEVVFREGEGHPSDFLTPHHQFGGGGVVSSLLFLLLSFFEKWTCEVGKFWKVSIPLLSVFVGCYDIPYDGMIMEPSMDLFGFRVQNLECPKIYVSALFCALGVKQ